MQFTVHEHASGSRLLSLLPPRYRPLLPADTVQTDTFTVLLFRTDRNDVILSRTVRKALERLSSDVQHQTIAVGGCFTQEALSALGERNAVVLTLSDFYWTDESYISITQR